MSEDPMTNSISEATLLLSRVKCALEGRAQAKAALEVKPRDLSAIMGAAKEITRQAETLVAVFEKMGGLETLEALVSVDTVPRNSEGPLDSEAVERVREAIATAERTESISATIRIDDLRALLNLAKPVGGEADEEARAERIKAAALTATKEDDRG